MLRMQFDGKDRVEAVSECSSAVEQLKKYLSVTTLDDPAVHPNQPPADAPAPASQVPQFTQKPQKPAALFCTFKTMCDNKKQKTG